MSICKNKQLNCCAGDTGAVIQGLQKYGKYSYCSLCVNDSIRKKIKTVFKNTLASGNYFNEVKCYDCGTGLIAKTTTLSYLPTCKFEHILEPKIAQSHIHAFCKKCSKKKKNLVSINPCPWITDELLATLDVFNKSIPIEIDSDEELGEKLETKEEEPKNTNISAVSSLFSFLRAAPPPVQPANIKERVAQLEDKISKMNLSYLLCAVCSDEEIYKRILLNTQSK